jgi:Dolichyl-phosphate-mannose-protein mannosyltransferase
MAADALSTTQTPPLSGTVVRPFALSRVTTGVGFIVAVTILALAVRVANLSTYGFSEDEINKVRAIEAYRRGDFTANAEHPMLMKLAMWTSTELTSAWNRIAPEGGPIAIETAVRLPNAVAGAATAAVIFALCQLLFGTSVAAMAAMFWTLDVNVIAINRIGKEDTFALFFFLLAIWCYERAKRQGIFDLRGAQRWYTGSGVAFGLMLSSKYFPQYLGVYALFNHLTDRNPGANRPHHIRHFGAMVSTFVIANFAVLDPASWRYGLNYVQGGMLIHHGYPFAGQVYANTSLLATNGIPVRFYLELLVTKVPLVILGAFVLGVIEMVRHRRERGFALLGLWLVLFSIGYSLTSVKFIRYALPLFTIIDILAAVGIVAGVAWLRRKRWLSPVTRVTVSAAAIGLSLAGPFAAQRSAAPFPSLHRNAIGERLAPAGATFPEELYDYGVREAVEAIADIAEPATVIVSDAPAVVAYYVQHGPRPDLRVRSLSAEGLAPVNTSSFVLVQGEHVTFENHDLIARLRHASTPWRQFSAGDACAVQVFRVPRS